MPERHESCAAEPGRHTPADVARAALRWSILDILDKSYRKLATRPGAKRGGLLLVEGKLGGRGAREPSGLMFVEGHAVLLREQAVVLLDGDNLEGRHVRLLCRVASCPGSGPYRAGSPLPLVEEAVLMDAATWSFYRSSPLRRLAYRGYGRWLELVQRLREAWFNASWPQARLRWAAGLAVVALALAFVGSVGLSLFESHARTSSALQRLGVRADRLSPRAALELELALRRAQAEAASMLDRAERAPRRAGAALSSGRVRARPHRP